MGGEIAQGEPPALPQPLQRRQVGLDLPRKKGCQLFIGDAPGQRFSRLPQQPRCGRPQQQEATGPPVGVNLGA